MGIDDIRDNTPPIPAGATPDDQPPEEARISDVPYIGDGFHSGGCRMYENDPEIVAARSRAYKRSQQQPDALSNLFGWLMDKVFLAERTGISKLLARIVKKISGNDRQPPTASSGDGQSSATETGAKPSGAGGLPSASSRQMLDLQVLGGGHMVTSCSILSIFNPSFALRNTGIGIMNTGILAPVKVF